MLGPREVGSTDLLRRQMFRATFLHRIVVVTILLLNCWALPGITLAASPQTASASESPAAIARAAALARQHRYKEAAGLLRGVPPPTASGERIAYYRLQASIAAGLGNA